MYGPGLIRRCIADIHSAEEFHHGRWHFRHLRPKNPVRRTVHGNPPHVRLAQSIFQRRLNLLIHICKIIARGSHDTCIYDGTPTACNNVFFFPEIDAIDLRQPSPTSTCSGRERWLTMRSTLSVVTDADGGESVVCVRDWVSASVSASV